MNSVFHVLVYEYVCVSLCVSVCVCVIGICIMCTPVTMMHMISRKADPQRTSCRLIGKWVGLSCMSHSSQVSDKKRPTGEEKERKYIFIYIYRERGGSGTERKRDSTEALAVH